MKKTPPTNIEESPTIKKVTKSKKEVPQQPNKTIATPSIPTPATPIIMSAFLISQQKKLIDIREVFLSPKKLIKPEQRSDDADLAEETSSFEFALETLANERNALYEINHALQKIEDGSYGICEVSGKKIPQERLRYLPYARHTVEAKGDLEKQQKQGSRRAQQSIDLFEKESESDSEPDDKDIDII